jgi:hypothetical protein
MNTATIRLHNLVLSIAASHRVSAKSSVVVVVMAGVECGCFESGDKTKRIK